MKSRSEARSKLAEEQHRQEEEAARAAQERRAQALRALDQFTRKKAQNAANHRGPAGTPSSSSSTTGGKQQKQKQKEKSMRRKTVIGAGGDDLEIMIKSAEPAAIVDVTTEKAKLKSTTSVRPKVPSLQMGNKENCLSDLATTAIKVTAPTAAGGSGRRVVGTSLSNHPSLHHQPSTSVAGATKQPHQHLPTPRPACSTATSSKAASSNSNSGAKAKHQSSARAAAGDALVQATKAKITSRRSLAPMDIHRARTKPEAVHPTEHGATKKVRRRSMLPSTSASLAVLVAATTAADHSSVSDHLVASASAPVSADVSMESFVATPSAAPSTNTSAVITDDDVTSAKKPKKRRVSVAVARFAQPTIAARMRVAAVTGNSHEVEKVDALIERRRKRSTMPSSAIGSLASAAAGPATSTPSAAASSAGGATERRLARPRPSLSSAQTPVVVNERLEKRRRAREERERDRMRSKITASIERGRSPTSPSLPAPTSAGRERAVNRARTTVATSQHKPRSQTSLLRPQPPSLHAGKERTKRYESILPKDLSSLLEEQKQPPLPVIVIDEAAAMSHDDHRSEEERREENKKSIEEQRVEELSELMLSHYTEDEASDSDSDSDSDDNAAPALADDKADNPKQLQLFKDDLDRQDDELLEDDANSEHVIIIDDERAGEMWEPVVEAWRLRVCAAVGQGLASLASEEEEELLWDVVEEALANVLPDPAYVPSTPAEEDMLARLVQKKVSDWMAYGKGRDDVEAMLRAGMHDKHERWDAVERGELLHLITALQHQHAAVGEAF